MVNSKTLLRLLPTFGILIFIALYIYTAAIYPGGSPADPNSVGYDWFNNLWCHLMDKNALNGAENPASSISIFAVVVLGGSMIIFFFLFARFFVKSRIWRITIKAAGVLAMASAAFIFTEYHDIMTTVLSVCGLFIIVAIIRTLFKNKMTFLAIIGIVCLIVIGLNNLFYYDEKFNDYLPIVQLVDFFLVLSWTVAINLKMINKDVIHEGA